MNAEWTYQDVTDLIDRLERQAADPSDTEAMLLEDAALCLRFLHRELSKVGA